ncbi:PH domain-containing protein [Corynebacterium pelargi]|uniref:Bacterial membrane flanked domain protein n=1 Tax=Corynebacterium pelargi TaxID=1471400 RepID=A0A410WAM9_9CORY|nr:PH domain-containing protein [Corynebacterium pelargi]QAU53011.1 Bacterial membrane flanked domain protein [Corynebacterium pelargi]
MRVHRLSPMVRIAQSCIAVLVVLLVREDFRSFILNHLSTWWIALLVLLGLMALTWVLSGIWWRATSFSIGEEISYEHGVFSKTTRSAQRENIQAVDVVEPFFPRLFGLAELRIETAGGDDSVIAIRYLRPAQAHELRKELLSHARHAGEDAIEGAAEDTDAQLLGHKDAKVQGHAHDGQAGDADVSIPVSRALLGAGLQQAPRLLILLLVFWVLDLASIGLIAIAFSVVPPLFRRLDQAWQMRLRFSNTLNLTYGLANRSHSDIPLRRVHAARIKQYPLWRFFGWWEVTLAVSGYTENTTVLPVGTREEVEEVLQRIFGRDMDIRATCSSPKQAKWISPIDWKQQQVELEQEHVVLSFGRIAPQRVLLNRADIQALELSHGPVQHKLGVCNLECSVVHGPVRAKIRDLRTEDAQRLLGQLRAGQ